MLRALVVQFRNWIFLFLLSGLSTVALTSGSGPSPSADRDLDFARDIRPILKVKDTAWVRNTIDRFVLERLEQEGLEPSPEASRETLIRRVTLDLIGLPPTPEDVDAFVEDRRPLAYERLVDRLLSSPRYGERWARPWLDLARYADTNGYIHDRRRNMWLYRDWVIKAINSDMPFDQFTIQQIAGDLLPDATPEQKIATGFHRNTTINTEGGIDYEEYRVVAILDRVETTGTVWLGSIIACAQCHDHKYDPITQEEYFQMYAFFNSTMEEYNPNTEIGWKQLTSPNSLVMKELEKPRTSHVFIKGSFLYPGKEVQPGVPSVLHPLPESETPPNRLTLARWLVSPENPLVGRVTMNRLWADHSGRALVNSPENLGTPQVLASPYSYDRYGESGAEISELLPHLTEVVDDITIVKSVHAEQFNHAPAQLFMNTGHHLVGRPSMGSWLTYGLGSENRDLPGFVVLQSGPVQVFAGSSCWGPAFLPTVYQGVQIRSQGDPVLFLPDPEWMTRKARRRSLDSLKKLNQLQYRAVGDPEILTRIASYELAYRMQTSVPELMDISDEPEHIHRMYGTEPGKESFANNCLLARRLVERGVRFVQLYHHGWDHHGYLAQMSIIHKEGLQTRCRETDQASAALIKDLKDRGLLDDTLVVWGGEFGRTPMNEQPGKYPGRDHHPYAFTMWLAGGGTKPGITVGKTDELGYEIVEDPIHLHDLHATILHLLGLDHTRLVYKFQGRQFRLTDVSGHVVDKLLA